MPGEYTTKKKERVARTSPRSIPAPKKNKSGRPGKSGKSGWPKYNQQRKLTGVRLDRRVKKRPSSCGDDEPGLRYEDQQQQQQPQTRSAEALAAAAATAVAASGSRAEVAIGEGVSTRSIGVGECLSGEPFIWQGIFDLPPF